MFDVNPNRNLASLGMRTRKVVYDHSLSGKHLEEVKRVLCVRKGIQLTQTFMTHQHFLWHSSKLTPKGKTSTQVAGICIRSSKRFCLRILQVRLSTKLFFASGDNEGDQWKSGS